MNAPLPDNEAQRLEELLHYKILDTPNEQAFDDLTRLAAYICGTPISLISLIDAQRQWFKSKVGLDVSETPREFAFCAHAIVQRDVFIVPDATRDERFATNPLVTSDPNVQFYAGVPLITPEKQALGTLCVIDHVPRNLSPEQLDALRLLGRQVIKQFELRRNLANLTLEATQQKHTTKARRQFFKEIAGGFGIASAILIIIGFVSYQSVTKQVETNSRVAHTQETLNKLEELLSQIKDAETGQRGYILTGEERYLKPYQTAITNFDGEINNLRKLTTAHPNQQRQLDALELLIVNKLAELNQTIDLRKKQGVEAALEVVRTDRGKKLMDDIRSLVAEMENEEKELLKQQVAAAGTSGRYTMLTLVITIVLAFVILCIIYSLIYQEITQRQWAQETLNKERNFISAVVDTSSALVIVLDRKGQIVRFNRACEQTTNYSFDEVRGRYFWNLFLIPEEEESVKAIFAQLQAGQFPNESENYWVTKDGIRRLIAWSNTALTDNQGMVEYIISTGIDITQRKQAEKALQESEEQYRSVVNNLKEVIFQTDAAMRLTFLNPAWTEIIGLSLYESLGKRFLEWIHPDDCQLQDEQFQAIREHQKEDSRYQIRYLTKNGSVAHMEVYAGAILADDGTFIGISGTLNDITGRKRREQQLSAEHATTRVLAESATLSQATPKILQAICESLGWDVGEFWSVEASENVLRRFETWHRQSVDVSEFEAASSQFTFATGVGLPGQVWESSEPTWIPNVVEYANFMRTSIASKVGLHAALGIPILSGDERLGVMTFFSREVKLTDIDFLRTMGTIGSQIGQFIKRKQAEEAVQRQNRILQAELNQAAEYVRSLLPSPLSGTVTTEVQFVPSLQLGGDAFDYYWLDADHLAVYLIDVSGHGVRAALLSVSVLNVLRSQSLPNTNFSQPSAVLAALNRVFQMSENGDDYFTIWYGVYNRVKRQLVYACAGHPPAILVLESSTTTSVKQLGSLSIPIGMINEADFEQDFCEIHPSSTLYLFSDGVYEIHRPNGTIWGLNAFMDLLIDYKSSNSGNLDKVLNYIQGLNPNKMLDDDFSLLQINLN